MYALDLMLQGGWVMWPILGASLVALGITLERVWLLYYRSRLNAPELQKKVLRLVEDRRYREALDACNVQTEHPLPRVLRAGLTQANRREKEIERAMEEELLRTLPRLNRGLSMMGLVANASTLMGLLGTIFGLIIAFEGVSAASAAARQKVLAEGISVAMYTTAFGLLVAIPVLFSHQIISSKVDGMLLQVEEGAVALLRALSNRLREVKGGPGTSGDLEDVA